MRKDRLVRVHHKITLPSNVSHVPITLATAQINNSGCKLPRPENTEKYEAEAAAR
jgi:hypothetical protein